MYKEKYNAQIVSVPCNAIELSSTELRNKIASGADISGFIDKNVSRYISERGLYS
jgi:nicotinic acid mononucleotide adenylyltransferase